MPNPFPGMNPYLEEERFKRTMQLNLSCKTADALNAVLPPDYFAANARRDWAGERWLEQGEHFVQIFHLSKRRIPVCVIEFLSIRRKIERRDEFRDLQKMRVHSPCHLLEIDLLRDGPTTVAGAVDTSNWPRNTHYAVSLHRAGDDARFEVWPSNVRQRLPRVPVPLRPEDGHVTLDVGALINTRYELARFARRLDYKREPVPPLTGDDATWLDSLLRERGLR